MRGERQGAEITSVYRGIIEGNDITLVYTGRPYGSHITNGSLDLNGGTYNVEFSGARVPEK